MQTVRGWPYSVTLSPRLFGSWAPQDNDLAHGSRMRRRELGKDLGPEGVKGGCDPGARPVDVVGSVPHRLGHDTDIGGLSADGLPPAWTRRAGRVVGPGPGRFSGR